MIDIGPDTTPSHGICTSSQYVALCSSVLRLETFLNMPKCRIILERSNNGAAFGPGFVINNSCACYIIYSKPEK